MTDEQIIKALECCMKTEFISDCAKCEMLAFDRKDTLIENALNLINRQKAEIEELRERISYLEKSIDCSRKEYNRLLQKLQQAKSEAIKEFAERLKKSDELYDSIRAIGNVNKIDCLIDTFDNLVEEMKEADK